MRKRLLFLLVLLPATAVAHDLYLVSGVAGAKGKICAHVGEHFPASMNAVTADRIERFAVREGEKTAALTGKVQGKQFCAPYPGKGPAIAEMLVFPRFILLKGKDFSGYIHGEGLTQVEKARQAAPDAPGRELYSRYSKLLLGAGEQATQPLGHTLEIVPEKDPSSLKPGEGLAVRVLFRGQPLADAQIAAVYAGAVLKAHEWPGVTRTDAQGRAVLQLDRAGLWYARMIYMVPAQGDPEIDWRSFFATLTFEVAGQR